MRAALAVLAAVVVACGSKAPDPRYPARPAGCRVKTFYESPDVAVDQLGDVAVECPGGAVDAKCNRMLVDEVCARGGDVVWGLREDKSSGKPRVSARAAHTAGRVFAAQPKGCEVQVFKGSPAMATENIGGVSAKCPETDANDVCLRALQDEACELGANVVWGVGEPVLRDGKKLYSGRAAHTK